MYAAANSSSISDHSCMVQQLQDEPRREYCMLQGARQRCKQYERWVKMDQVRFLLHLGA
jgi:hypothetical protein